MSDEGKPIEEIIAELETLEMKRAEQLDAEEPGASDVEAEISVENSQQLSDTPYENPEELTMEETSLGSEGDPPPGVESSSDEYEDIFGENGKEEHHDIESPDELVLESQPEEGIPLGTLEGTAFENTSAGNTGGDKSLEPLGELILEEPFDELILDDESDGEMLILETGPDEAVPAEGNVIGENEERPIEEKIFDDIFAEKMNGSHAEDATEADVTRRLSMEALAKEFADLELTPEVPLEDMTVEISLESGLEDTFKDVHPGEPVDDAKSSGISLEESARQVETEGDAVGPAWDSADDSWSLEPPLETLAAGGVMNMNTKGGESDEESQEPPSPPPEKRGGRRIGLLFILFLVTVAGYAYFVWPTMYRHGQMISGDRTYSTRIHRITQVEEYSLGGMWHRGSGPTVIVQSTPPEKVITKPIVTAQKSPAVEAEKHTDTETQPAEQSPVKAVLHKIEKQEQVVARDAEASVSPEVANDKGMVSADESESPGGDVQPAKAGAPPEGDVEQTVAAVQAEKVSVDAPRDITANKEVEDTAPAPVNQESAGTLEAKVDPTPKTAAPVSQKKDNVYAIQIGSMRFLEFANDIVNELDKKDMDPHMQIVETARNGVWYVVYCGQFDNKQKALQYLKDTNITKMYPGCYIRKISLVTAQK